MADGREVAGAIDAPHPFEGRERFEAMDVLRGFALLGILVVNILSFSQPWAVMIDPRSVWDYEGTNRVFLWITHVFFSAKMMSLFSMLFGAGVIMYDRKGRTGRLTENTGLWYSRMGWLLVIGIVHAVAIWYGDILVWYAVSGLTVLWWVRKLSPNALTGLALVCFAIFAMLSFAMNALMMFSPEAQEAIEAGKNPALAMFDPQEEIDAYRGGWLDNFMGHRLVTVLIMWFLVLPFQYYWMVTGVMLLGMALTKAGVLTGQRSTRFYAITGVALSALGVVTMILHMLRLEADGFRQDAITAIVLGLSAPVQAIGYACLIQFLWKLGVLEPLWRALSSVGRMALTSYLLTSVLATALFYGWGLGWFGRMDYPELAYVTLVLWAVMLVFSVAWLRFFRFGPMEWLWRSLTYFRVQPMRKTHAR